MTDSDIAARAPEPREAPSELEELQGPLRGAGAAQRRPRGDDRHTKKRPRRRPVRPHGGGVGRRWLTGSGGASGGGRRRRRCPCRAARSTTAWRRPPRRDPYAALRPLVRAAFGRRPGAPTATAASAPSSRGAPARRSGPAARRGSTRRGRWRSPRRWCAGSWPRRGCAPAPRGRPATAPTPARRAARRRPTCCWSTPAATCTTSRPPPPARSWSPTSPSFRLPDDPRKVYLSPAVDLFDGDVAAFSVGTSPSKALVAEMLAGAVAAAGGGFTLHSDRGWHYRAPDSGPAPAGRPGWRGRCRARGTRRTTPPARGSSAGSRSSSSTGGTGAGSPPSGSPPSSPSGSAGTGRGG